MVTQVECAPVCVEAPTAALPVNPPTATPVAASEPVAAVAWTSVNGVIERSVVSDAGTISAGKASVTISNVGEAAGSVGGVLLYPGQSVSWSAYADPVNNQFVRLPAIAYNGAGTTLHLVTQD